MSRDSASVHCPEDGPPSVCVSIISDSFLLDHRIYHLSPRPCVPDSRKPASGRGRVPALPPVNCRPAALLLYFIQRHHHRMQTSINGDMIRSKQHQVGPVVYQVGSVTSRSPYPLPVKTVSPRIRRQQIVRVIIRQPVSGGGRILALSPVYNRPVALINSVLTPLLGHPPSTQLFAAGGASLPILSLYCHLHLCLSVLTQYYYPN